MRNTEAAPNPVPRRKTVSTVSHDFMRKEYFRKQPIRHDLRQLIFRPEHLSNHPPLDQAVRLTGEGLLGQANELFRISKPTCKPLPIAVEKLEGLFNQNWHAESPERGSRTGTGVDPPILCQKFVDRLHFGTGNNPNLSENVHDISALIVH